MNEIVFTPARKLARLIRTRKVSALEVMTAFIAQVERVNPKVNAIVTFLPEQALAEARRIDRLLARAARKSGTAVPPLAGLPIAYKDLIVTKGIRTTFGSRIYKDNVPAVDHAIVERLMAAGVITLGKTNTPEFGAGSQTFNDVFGATHNPWDLTKTCGGSSGGAGVAVACGMLPFADGTDLGGSLRNPGNFNGVVGLRPSPGRVPNLPSPDVWNALGVAGPMARTVDDTAFLLAAMAGPDPRSPISIDESGAVYARIPERSFRRVRVAFWPLDRMNGSGRGSRLRGGEDIPVDGRVVEVIEGRRKVFESLGCIVEDAHPDLAGADEVFKALRALSALQRFGPLVAKHGALMKDTVHGDIAFGRALGAEAIARAFGLRSEIFRRMQEFMARYEFLLMPVNQVPPFPLEEAWPRSIEGVKMDTYIDWMKSCHHITVTGHPAISVPAGFTRDEPPLPVGLQIVGRYRDERALLQIARAFEATNGLTSAFPPAVH